MNAFHAQDFFDLKCDVLDRTHGEIFYSLREAQAVIEKWRVGYNKPRPHSARGYRPPTPATYIPLVPPNPISRPDLAGIISAATAALATHKPPQNNITIRKPKTNAWEIEVRSSRAVWASTPGGGSRPASLIWFD